MKRKPFHPKIAIPLQIGLIIPGLLFASFGAFIYPKNPEKTIPLVVLIFSACIILSGLWMIERVKIEDDFIEKSNFLGLIKRRRNLNNLKSIKGSQKSMYRASMGVTLFLTKPFINNIKYANRRYLTLEFRGERKFVIDGLGIKRKDFDKIIALLKNSQSKNRKRIRKQNSQKNS